MVLTHSPPPLFQTALYRMLASLALTGCLQAADQATFTKSNDGTSCEKAVWIYVCFATHQFEDYPEQLDQTELLDRYISDRTFAEDPTILPINNTHAKVSFSVSNDVSSSHIQSGKMVIVYLDIAGAEINKSDYSVDGAAFATSWALVGDDDDSDRLQPNRSRARILVRRQAFDLYKASLLTDLYFQMRLGTDDDLSNPPTGDSDEEDAEMLDRLYEDIVCVGPYLSAGNDAMRRVRMEIRSQFNQWMNKSPKFNGKPESRLWDPQLEDPPRQVMENYSF